MLGKFLSYTIFLSKTNEQLAKITQWLKIVNT